MNKEIKKAYFAAGCFWGVEDKFKKLEGVVDTTVGFMGGDVENPSYKQVCNTDTCHAETVEVKFDPSVISYEKLLEKFWGMHDPTQLNKQGPDVGSQYRSVVFYVNEDQKEKALRSKETLDDSEKFEDKIVTEVVPADDFYGAEQYHQDYYDKQK